MANTPYTTCSNNSAGFLIPACALGAGGLSTIWISQATGLTWTFDVDNQVTNISGASFYRFDLVQESGELDADNIKTNLQNTSQYYESNITLIIPKKSVAIRNQVRALAASGSYIITLDNNGIYQAFGFQNKCYVTDGSGKSGKSLGDANNWTLKFTAKEGQPSFILSGSGAFTSSY